MDKLKLLLLLMDMDLESISIDNETEVVMAGGTSRFDPPYEEGPYRKHRLTGRSTITIVGTM